MTAFSNLIPTERRALRANGTGATVASADAANAGVILFTTNTGTIFQGTAYILGTTAVAPVAGSGNWINAVSDANMGSVFKFNRRGVYMASLYAGGTVGDAAAAQIGITLDCAATIGVIGTSALTAATVGLIDLNNTDGVAAAAIPSRAAGPVYITDTLAGGAQPTSAVGVFSGGVGVLRFHATNGAGAVVATAFIVTTIRAEIVYENDLAG
jgi:hypothetical protein